MFDSCIMALQFADYPMRKVILDFTSRFIAVCKVLEKGTSTSDHKKSLAVQQYLRGSIFEFRTLRRYHVAVEDTAKTV